jgi:hypothetical protein
MLALMTSPWQRVGKEAERNVDRVGRRDLFWPAQLAVLAAIALYFALPAKLTVGPTWLIPALEIVLFLGLVITSPMRTVRHYPRWRRRLGLATIALVSAAYLASLGLLTHYLLRGGKAGGRSLIFAGITLWVTNVLIFSIWYWELDRGGPVTRMLERDAKPDFLFPQMSDAREWAPKGWRPSFLDYLYVSLTNATAFSPTDTMPLSEVAKSLMGVQAVAALVTVGLVVARAVNILS